jgi:hypothetical protein
VSATLAAVWTLLLAQQEPASQPAPLPTLHVVTPLAKEDAEALQRWWDGRERELGAKARVDRAASLGAPQLLPDTLLLAFEAGFLEELGRDGALLAEAADVAAAVHPIAVESWTMAWSADLGDDAPGLDTYRALLDESLRGRFRMRRITATGPEGLVVSEIRARLDADVERMVLATDAAGTVLASDLPFDELLRTLPAKGVTLAPVRAVVKARRAGRPVVYGIPREGLVGLTLAAALTHGSTKSSAAVLAALVTPALRDDLCRALELEPIGVADASFPEWIRIASERHAADAIRRERAGVERLHLAAWQAGGAPEGARTEGDWLEDLLDGAMVTGAAVLAFVAIRLVRRTPR